MHNHNHTNNTNPKYNLYKELLEKEEDRLIESMSFLGHMSNDATGEWTVDISKPEDIREFDNESDRMEEAATNESILETLEERLKEVRNALAKIEKGDYGKCEICQKEIEEDKLKANPATTKCMGCEVE
jgi:RNA polymerase-binding transcription factor DksA